MIWRIQAKGSGQHEVFAVQNVGGSAWSCGTTNDSIPDIEAFIFTHAKPNDVVHYPDGRVARISGMALA